MLSFIFDFKYRYWHRFQIMCIVASLYQPLLIPAAFTGELQPMDISVNSGEVFHPQQFFRLVCRVSNELFCNDDDDPVDLSTARMKCLSAQ